MSDAPSDLARRVADRCRLSGDFTLRSGQKATTSFDKYLLESDPALLRDVVQEMVPLIPPRTEVLAGLALRDQGAIVEHALCVIDRSGGDPGKLDAVSMRVLALFVDAQLAC